MSGVENVAPLGGSTVHTPPYGGRLVMIRYSEYPVIPLSVKVARALYSVPCRRNPAFRPKYVEEPPGKVMSLSVYSTVG